MAKQQETEKTAPKTSAVRIRPSIHERASKASELTNYSLAQVAEMCIEDCLDAVDTGKPVMPRIAKIAIALKK